jgi:hypothetical protein
MTRAMNGEVLMESVMMALVEVVEAVEAWVNEINEEEPIGDIYDQTMIAL